MIPAEPGTPSSSGHHTRSTDRDPPGPAGGPGSDPAPPALGRLRICDLTGQLAGAGSTRFLACFGAEVIRVEDPVHEGRWDILRGAIPFVDERRGINLGGAFNNHNVEKLGITLNLKDSRGRRLFEELVAICDVVTENFAAGVMDRLGLGYERLRELRPDIIYVSHSGFGHDGPYRGFKSWGPVVQALCGLTATSGLQGEEPAGWGYSFMDHAGAYFMALATLAAVVHRDRTGEGQWIDLATMESGASLLGPQLLEASMTGRSPRPGERSSNREPGLCPHGIYPAAGENRWIAIACRSDPEWVALRDLIGEEWAHRPVFDAVAGREGSADELDDHLRGWTCRWEDHDLAGRIRSVGVPAAAVLRPAERIDGPAGGREPGRWLWPEVRHEEMGPVRVDGLPVLLSRTNWSIRRGAPCLGADNDRVIGGLLHHGPDELERWRTEGVI